LEENEWVKKEALVIESNSLLNLPGVRGNAVLRKTLPSKLKAIKMLEQFNVSKISECAVRNTREKGCVG